MLNDEIQQLQVTNKKNSDRIKQLQLELEKNDVSIDMFVLTHFGLGDSNSF